MPDGAPRIWNMWPSSTTPARHERIRAHRIHAPRASATRLSARPFHPSTIYVCPALEPVIRPPRPPARNSTPLHPDLRPSAPRSSNSPDTKSALCSRLGVRVSRPCRRLASHRCRNLLAGHLFLVRNHHALAWYGLVPHLARASDTNRPRTRRRSSRLINNPNVHPLCCDLGEPQQECCPKIPYQSNLYTSNRANPILTSLTACQYQLVRLHSLCGHPTSCPRLPERNVITINLSSQLIIVLPCDQYPDHSTSLSLQTPALTTTQLDTRDPKDIFTKAPYFGEPHAFFFLHEYTIEL